MTTGIKHLRDRTALIRLGRHRLRIGKRLAELANQHTHFRLADDRRVDHPRLPRPRIREVPAFLAHLVLNALEVLADRRFVSAGLCGYRFDQLRVQHNLIAEFIAEFVRKYAAGLVHQHQQPVRRNLHAYHEPKHEQHQQHQSARAEHEHRRKRRPIGWRPLVRGPVGVIFDSGHRLTPFVIQRKTAWARFPVRSACRNARRIPHWAAIPSRNADRSAGPGAHRRPCSPHDCFAGREEARAPAKSSRESR